MENSDLPNRSRQLGKVLETCRENSEKTLVKTATFLGISPDDLLRFERGESEPSLPQLEVLADFFRVPIKDLIDPSAQVVPSRKLEAEKVPSLVDVRSRIIAIRVKKERIAKGIRLDELAAAIGISSDDLESMEAGDNPIPFSILDKICERLNLSIQSLVSSRESQSEKTPAENTNQIPLDEWQEFSKNPANLRYLEFAKELKNMDPAILNTLCKNLARLSDLQ